MRRRNWVLGGAGVAALAAGAGWRLWRGDAQAPAATASLPAAPAELWQATFDQPDGRPLAFAPLLGQPLVLNFWATWCPPCVKEMPELDRFARSVAARGIHVVGLAIDSPTPVRQFLARSPVSYRIGLAGFAGTDLSRSLGNEKGALPFTAVFDRKGVLVQRKLGETHFDELSRWVAAL